MINKKSKIYITGDMHGEIGISKFNSNNFPEGKTLTKDDYVIVLGDFGLVWNYKETGCSVPSNPNDKCWTREEYYWLKWLNNYVPKCYLLRSSSSSGVSFLYSPPSSPGSSERSPILRRFK